MKLNSTAGDIEILDLGLIDFAEALNLQHSLVERRLAGIIPDTVIIAEHSPVITLGARQTANRLLADSQTLRLRNIPVVRIRRGGGATAHNPGQVIAYPIMNLGRLGGGVSAYVRRLEEAAAELVTSLGVSCRRRHGLPGIWTDERKIASVGVRVRRQVTYHGVAVNISNDLGIFDLLVPCGLENVRMTSVAAETGVIPPMSEVRRLFAGIIRRVFEEKLRIHNGAVEMDNVD